MTPKQRLFVAEYLKDLNATQAAIRAGYSEKTARSQGERLLTHVDIAPAIAAKTAQQLEKVDLSAERVLEEMRRLALGDVRGLFDESGDLKPLHTLTEAQAAMIGGFEVIIKNAKAGDGHTDTIHKVRIWDKTRALEMLGKHFALLTEHVVVHDSEKFQQLIDSARQRMARKKTA
jgi:phage terminase small subunit